MINSLYSFSPDSNVVADEWNANFNALAQSNNNCAVGVSDANNELAFLDSDLTGAYTAIRARQNSFPVGGTSVIVSPQCEYYKTLLSGEDLNIQVPSGFNSEARIWIQITDERDLLPFSVAYPGTVKTNYGGILNFQAGYYLIVLYEINNILQLKMVKAETGA